MKKTFFAALALTVALPFGAFADDLALPNGTVWPLGKEISVHAGSDSYFAPKVAEWLADKKLPKDIAAQLVKAGVYDKKEKKDAEIFAEGLVKILRDARVYQLSGTRGTDLHVATVVSGTAPTDFFKANKERWENFMTAQREKLAVTEEGKTALAVYEENLASLSEMEQLVRKTEGVTASGAAYETGALYAAPELDGYTAPFFVYWLRVKQDGADTLTVIATDQASGSFFEPFLEKGVGELK